MPPTDAIQIDSPTLPPVNSPSSPDKEGWHNKFITRLRGFTHDTKLLFGVFFAGVIIFLYKYHYAPQCTL